jgi:hypothetical protein
VRRRLWWVPWLLGIVAAIALVAVVVVALARSGVTDAQRACALVRRPAADVFGAGTRLEPDEGDCIVHLTQRVVVVHVYGRDVGEAHFRASRGAVARTDPTVSDAPVRGGEAFFADDRATLWAWDPSTRVEFALFTSGGASRRLVALANAVLAR